MVNYNSITNNQFLSTWHEQGPTEAILIHEAAVIKARLTTIKASFERIIDEKLSVTGGDDWHDGAFRSTDLAANNLSEQQDQLTRLLRLVHVDLPEESSDVVSLGSHVRIAQNQTAPYSLNIVGAKYLYPDSEEVELATLMSPLGRQLIGHHIGETITCALAGKLDQKLVILDSGPMSPAYITDK